MNPEAREALGERSTETGRGPIGSGEGREDLGKGGTEFEEEAGPGTDLLEFAGAFAVGALVGAGLMLLMRPRQKTGTERIRHDLKPYRKKMKASAESARRSFAEGADATTEVAEAIGQASRTLLHGLREEVGEIIGSAREELAEAVNEQVAQAMKTLRRGSRQKG